MGFLQLGQAYSPMQPYYPIITKIVKKIYFFSLSPGANEICCNLKKNILELTVFTQQREQGEMKIILNGQKKELGHNQNLKDIINKSCKNASYIIAEVNGEIIQSPQWPQTVIRDGDSLELLNFVGGG